MSAILVKEIYKSRNIYSIHILIWKYFQKNEYDQALQLVTSVFQLFGLRVAQCSTLKIARFQRIIKYYPLLIIARLRFVIVIGEFILTMIEKYIQ